MGNGSVAGDQADSHVPTTLYLVIGGSDHWQSAAVRRRLLDVLRSQSTQDAGLHWNEPIVWDDQSRVVRLSCTAIGQSYATLADAAVSRVAHAANHVLPGQESAVTVEKASVQLPDRPARHSTLERWGWYAVTLLLEASWIRKHPEAARFMAEEFAKWERFRTASFAWNEADAVATFSVELIARSANGADSGAREALESLMWATVEDPGDYELKSLKVEWISEPPLGTR